MQKIRLRHRKSFMKLLLTPSFTLNVKSHRNHMRVSKRPTFSFYNREVSIVLERVAIQTIWALPHLTEDNYLEKDCSKLYLLIDTILTRKKKSLHVLAPFQIWFAVRTKRYKLVTAALSWVQFFNVVCQTTTLWWQREPRPFSAFARKPFIPTSERTIRRSDQHGITSKNVSSCEVLLKWPFRCSSCCTLLNSLYWLQGDHYFQTLVHWMKGLDKFDKWNEPITMNSQ